MRSTNDAYHEPLLQVVTCSSSRNDEGGVDDAHQVIVACVVDHVDVANFAPMLEPVRANVGAMPE